MGSKSETGESRKKKSTDSKDVMNLEIKIEPLKASNKPELLEVFTEAFRDYPFFPGFKVISEPERRLLKAALDLGVGMKGSWLYGIRESSRLVCASISVSSLAKPSILSLARVAFSMIVQLIYLRRKLGRYTLKELLAFFERVFYKEKPKYKEPHLELLIFGTVPTHQRRGFGRKMLHFLYEKARNEGYRGIILLTNPEAPAFSLYLKEGFNVEKKLTLGEMALCWMRLVL